MTGRSVPAPGRVLLLLRGCLAAGAIVVACSGTGLGSGAPSAADQKSGRTPLTAATPTATPTGSPSPSASPTPRSALAEISSAVVPVAQAPITRPAWTTRAVTVYWSTSRVFPQVTLGPNFPLAWTYGTALVNDRVWNQVMWQTPTRHGTGWVDGFAISLSQPSGQAQAGIDALDEGLEKYLEKYGSRVGVEVLDVTRGVAYGYNANKQFVAASSMKVPIMLTLLAQLEARKREPTARELHLLTSMIEFSNNDAARALYKEVGDKAGATAYLKRIGVKGITPARFANGFGVSLISPAGMVSLLDKLRSGATLNDAHRALALRLMSHVTPHQRVGVGDSSPAGAQVALKDGWVKVNDGSGTSVMNSSGIVTVGSETYILAVYTDRDRGWNEGFVIARHVCRAIGNAMVPPS